MKKQRGITLIAVIITVIIMLILVGTSLNLAIGNNGILKNTEVATKKNNESEYKECILEAWAYVLADLEDNYMPYENTTEGKNIAIEASSLFTKYILNYGTGKLVSSSEKYVYNITLKEDNKTVQSYKIEMTLKGDSEKQYYYIVDDTKVYSSNEISNESIGG